MREESKTRTNWKALLLLALILFVLAGIIRPQFEKAQIAGKRAKALSHSKAIAGGLITFKTDFGQYPCDATRDLLLKKGMAQLPLGSDANAYLAQLIVTDIIDSEARFYARKMQHMFKGDNNISNAKEILSKGENGFAYIIAQNNKPLTDVKSITPLIIAPILTAGENPTFDPLPYQGYYVYGAVDGSGKQGKISPTGQALSKDRTHLFQTGPNSLFGSEIPVVKPPLGL